MTASEKVTVLGNGPSRGALARLVMVMVGAAPGGVRPAKGGAPARQPSIGLRRGTTRAILRHGIPDP